MEGCLHWRETNLEVSCRLIVAAIALDPGPIRVLHFDPKVVISYGVENPQGPSSRSNHCIQTPYIPVFFLHITQHIVYRDITDHGFRARRYPNSPTTTYPLLASAFGVQSTNCTVHIRSVPTMGIMSSLSRKVDIACASTARTYCT